jgi:hypothetical protein
MSQIEVDYLGEGRSDSAIARKLISSVHATPGVDYLVGRTRARGKAMVDQRVRGLNAGVLISRRPTLVLRDLDNDAQCPSDLVSGLLPNRGPSLLLRVCVRSAETWLLADAGGYAKFCGISPGMVPTRPKELPNPKQTILGWAVSGKATYLARYYHDAKRRGVPNWALLGEWHADFADRKWDPQRAANLGNAPSLVRALKRLEIATRT